MVKKYLATAVIVAGIISMAVSGCGPRNTNKERKKLKSTVILYRILKDTNIEEPAFIFTPKDFIRVVIVQHAFFDPLDVVSSPFELRGILNAKMRRTFASFTRGNIGHKIKVTIDNQAANPGSVLNQAINYVPLGCYFNQEKALKAAQKLTYEPEFEDWREREHIEQDVLKKEMLQY